MKTIIFSDIKKAQAFYNTQEGDAFLSINKDGSIVVTFEEDQGDHIKVLSCGVSPYAQSIKVGDKLRIVKGNKDSRFFYVETICGKHTFKVSSKTKRACGVDIYWLDRKQQPQFEF